MDRFLEILSGGGVGGGVVKGYGNPDRKGGVEPKKVFFGDHF